MASKKHRPIVMNRNKAAGRTYNILKRILAITAILALIEVVILVVLHFKNENKATTTVKTPERPKEAEKEIPKVVLSEAVKDTPKPAAVSVAKVIDDNKPKDTIVKKDTTVTMKPVAVKAKPLVKKPVSDTIVKPAIKPEIKIANKVSDEKMFEILNQVRMEKLQANNAAKCVSIQIVSSSNAENGFRIANYLRKNGYVISGREVIPGEQKGIQINAAGPCIKLAIGDL